MCNNKFNRASLLWWGRGAIFNGLRWSLRGFDAAGQGILPK